MDASSVLGSLVRVKDASELSGVRHSEAFFTAGEPGKRSGPEKTLQVYYGVKFTLTKAADKRHERAERSRVVPGLSEELAVEKDDIG
ncbi:unnamed protein product [marine sediment metagenome]|uniref:Uncharacterized protein n=1 Tax=marine sediment metagenome TaxID=412755 RepID=X1DLR8_9ZZZZ